MAANSKLSSESEDMEHEYFDEDPTNGARSTITDSVTESSKNYENQTTSGNIKPPKQIMVHKINDVTEFTAEVESDSDPNLEVQISGRWAKINSQTLAVKTTKKN